MKRAILASCTCALLATAPASAQNLGDLLGTLQGGETSGAGLLDQVQNTAKASAFDALIGSQVPALSGLTQNLSAEQKAMLFDLGADNMGTLGALGSGGTLATGAAALGLVPQAGAQQPATARPNYATIPQPVQPAYARPQPTYQPSAPAYQQAQPPYGAVQPTYQPQPTYQQTQPIYGSAQPVYQQIQPAYGAATVQPTQPAYGTTTVQPAYRQTQPAYGTATVQPVYAQPTYQAQPQQPGHTAPVPATETQTTSQQDMIGNLIRLGLGALGN